MYDLIQLYLDSLYSPFKNEIQQSLRFGSNETYGELFFYSIPTLLKYVPLLKEDRFLDIGCGVGKLIFSIFLTTDVASITGIEINVQRYTVAQTIKENLQVQFTEMFNKDHALDIIHGDFLENELTNITIIYVCSAVFTYDLLGAMGKKINSLPRVRKIISFRKLPFLDNFKLTKRIHLHCSWDRVACYIYSRNT